MKNIMTLDDIAKRCNVKSGAIRSFIKYCIETKKELPAPIPYQRQHYTYTKENAETIIKMFKSKKRGEMAEFNYRYSWGKAFQSKYPRKIQQN